MLTTYGFHGAARGGAVSEHCAAVELSAERPEGLGFLLVGVFAIAQEVHDDARFRVFLFGLIHELLEGASRAVNVRSSRVSGCFGACRVDPRLDRACIGRERKLRRGTRIKRENRKTRAFHALRDPSHVGFGPLEARLRAVVIFGVHRAREVHNEDHVRIEALGAQRFIARHGPQSHDGENEHHKQAPQPVETRPLAHPEEHGARDRERNENEGDSPPRHEGMQSKIHRCLHPTTTTPISIARQSPKNMAGWSVRMTRAIAPMSRACAF